MPNSKTKGQTTQKGQNAGRVQKTRNVQKAQKGKKAQRGRKSREKRPEEQEDEDEDEEMEDEEDEEELKERRRQRQQRPLRTLLPAPLTPYQLWEQQQMDIERQQLIQEFRNSPLLPYEHRVKLNRLEQKLEEELQYTRERYQQELLQLRRPPRQRLAMLDLAPVIKGQGAPPLADDYKRHQEMIDEARTLLPKGKQPAGTHMYPWNGPETWPKRVSTFEEDFAKLERQLEKLVGLDDDDEDDA